MRNNLSALNVYIKKNTKSEVVTQLLYGETFRCIENKKNWIKIKNNIDGYVGFIKRRKFLKKEKSTHKVCNLYAILYSKPNVQTNKKISFGSRIKALEIKKNFIKFDNNWVKKSDVKKINFKTKDIFKNINKFLNVKYKWGGKHFKGIDCSALVQLFFNFNNKYCPRDAKDQIKYFKKKILLKNIKKNDLIFWKGHVAIAISNKYLVHAYGPFKKTVIMSIKNTINRIYKTADLKVIGIRRPM